MLFRSRRYIVTISWHRGHAWYERKTVTGRQEVNE
jgi:hypothetical protein